MPETARYGAMKNKYLSICAIVKNEALYIDEWIRFHYHQGVEHFFIYENESTDITWDILKFWEKQGIATIEKLPGSSQQKIAYEKCLKEHGHESQWVAFLDCDEFLYSPTGRSLPAILEDFEKYSAVAVNWVLYGSNGHKKYSSEPVITRFTKRARHADRHVKTILQPHRAVSTGNNAHYFLLKSPAVNEKQQYLPAEYYWTEPSIELLRINHYHTKSLEEYMKRKSYIDVDGVNRGETMDRFMGHDVNDVEDLSALEAMKS